MTTKIPEILRPYLKKKWIWLFGGIAVLFILFGIAWSIEYEKMIDQRKLPSAAHEFLSQYYPDNRVAIVKKELDELCVTYEVVFVDGTKVEFRGNGEWKKISCSRGQQVHETIIPQRIKDYAGQNFPGMSVTEIEHKHRVYEVELDKSVELSFDDQRFVLVDYDN